MAYRFNGSSGNVTFDSTPFLGTLSAFTFAMLYKRQAYPGGAIPWGLTSSTGTIRARHDYASATAVRWVTRNGGTVHTATKTDATLDNTGSWMALVITVDGSGVVRFHRNSGSGWMHYAADSGDTVVATIIAGDILKMDASFFQADVCCVGAKKAGATDLQVEALSVTSFAAWRAFGFDWLIGYDGASTRPNVANPGTGDETARANIVQVGDPPGWSWPSPAFRGAGSVVYSGTGTLTLAPPTGTVAGDLLVVQLAAPNTTTVSTPSGWTKLLGPTSMSGASNTNTGYIFWKIAGASEPSVNFTLSGGGNQGAGIMSAYSGADGTTPVDVYATANNATSGTSGTTPSVTTTGADRRLLRLYWNWTSSATITPPGTDTERYDSFDSHFNIGFQLADSAQASAGASGTTTATFSTATSGGLTATIALEPVSAVTSVSATRALQYNVLGSVAATRALQYNVGGGVAATRQLLYDVFQSVASSVHLLYNVQGRVAATRTLRYQVVGSNRVAAARVLMWNNDGADELQGRFCIAFNATALEWDAAIFTRMDDPVLYPGLVTSYQIDRGRQYELDRTDTGRATVVIADRDGILNPRNPDGPFYRQLRPLLQACINRYNPTTGAWRTRFRGYIEDMTYSFDPSQRVNRLTITLVDQFEILSAIEMQPGRFGSGLDSDGQLVFAQAQVNDRIIGVLNDAGLQPHARVIFSGNVILQKQPYSAGESPMTVIQEAADGEFPGVSNVYCDRKGRLCFHGRFAKFDPERVAAGASIGAWDFQRWQIGDGAAVNASPATTAQVRAFGFNRGLSKIINQATATPNGIADTAVAGQLIEDVASTSKYGIRSWSATNLVTKSSVIDGSDSLTETRRFGTYYVQNYAEPRDRIEGVQLRALLPSDPRAEYLWKLLTEIDIADAAMVTVASPGGGGFEAESYFVEGVHESAQALGDDDLDDVILTLDLSPEAYFDANPWPTPDGG